MPLPLIIKVIYASVHESMPLLLNYKEGRGEGLYTPIMTIIHSFFGCVSMDVLSKLKLLWNVWLVNVSVNLLHDEPVTYVQ